MAAQQLGSAPTLPLIGAATQGSASAYPDGTLCSNGSQVMVSYAGLWATVGSTPSQERVGTWNAAFGVSAVLSDGIIAATFTGTATPRTLAVTNFATFQRRVGSVSAATAGALCGFRSSAVIAARGNAPGIGGFKISCQFQCADTVATARQYVGLSASISAPTNVEPSTLINSIGVGHGAADTNLKLYASGTTAQPPVDLGANFPPNTTTDPYRLTLSCAPNATAITWQVDRLNTAFSATGTINAAAQLPAAAQNLAWQMWRTNNTTATAVALDLSRLELVTPY